MTVKNPTNTENPASAEYWKARFEKQRFLINSMTSLLNRYGSSIELDHLYSAFLLTLMGQLVVSDACYYAHFPEVEALTPALAYGRLTRDNLPPVTVGSGLTDQLQKDPMPALVENLPPNLAAATEMKFLAGYYRLFAPLFLKGKLVGALLLGDKISKQPFTSKDLEVLSALCAVSATTFNNAILYENAKHSAREIQRLYDVRNEVINRITHEFRTPLTILKAGVELLAKDENYKDLANMFVDSEARLEDLINSLLSLSQATSRDDETEHLTDPLSVLHDTVGRYGDAAREKKIQFRFIQSEGSVRPILHISDVDFRAILDALIANALKFSPAGSSITLEVERSAAGPNPHRDGLQLPDWREQTEDLIREYEDMTPGDSVVRRTQRTKEKPTQIEADEFLVVRISDNGIGIPEGELLSVTEPFRQASNSPDIGVKGTGLGLALVHKIVARHGGYLCCKSAEDRGAKFSVFLPIATASQP
jgi:signal transduction histidine kinase